MANAVAPHSARQATSARRLKLDLLLNGIDVRQPPSEPFKERTEHLYRHDRGALPVAAIPQELIVTTAAAESCVVNVRHNPSSPWILTTDLLSNSQTGEKIATRAIGRPRYYGRTINSRPVERLVQHMGTDLIGIVPNNHCAYFEDDLQCHFCEIEASFNTTHVERSSRKNIETMTEALVVACTEPSVRHLVITSGNFHTNDYGAKLVAQLVREIRSSSAHAESLYIFTSIMPPDDHSLIGDLKEAGVDGIAFNIEFWRQSVFESLAPGKAAYGRRRIIAALSTAGEIFQRGNVYSNLVYGIQTISEPEGGEADRCLEAATELLEIGVLPLFTLYHTMGVNKTGEVSLATDEADSFFDAYGLAVRESEMVPSSRTGVLFNVTSITNHVYNDYFAAADTRR